MSARSSKSVQPLPPGSTIGLLGGGQLGRMFAKAAARLGFHVHVFAPDEESPAAEVSLLHTRASYNDLDAVARFAQSVDAITYEFENVLGPTVETADRFAPVRPHSCVLSVTRNRLAEKGFLSRNGIPVAPYSPAASAEELEQARQQLGGRVVVKTTAFGYDGKGQSMCHAAADSIAAWGRIGAPGEAIVEQFIPFEGECSMLVARGMSGKTVFFGPFFNEHRNHILDVTTWSADDSSAVAREAREISAAVADALALDGMICIEFFITGKGLLVNEIAPRPHNSGHLTLEACSISQFEQQVRMAAGYDPVEPVPRAPAAAMINLLGDLWTDGEPDWSAVLARPEISFHLYGKSEPKPDRKMGHLTVLAETPDAAAAAVKDARRALRRSPEAALNEEVA
ncbi:MAG TPA: 5-(carboxyamino)imidazole ribonucleotide synthase [Pontiella sp.]